VSAAPRLAVIGDGKMGRAVAQLAAERGWPVTAVIGAAGNHDGAGITRQNLAGATVAIEFTEPGAAASNVRACVAVGCAVVVGTTGWYEQLGAVEADVRRAGGAMLWASNFSIGVNIFADVVADAARRLGGVRGGQPGDGFGMAIVETHHAMKKDAPSGTAQMLRRRILEALGSVRQGSKESDVPVTSVRAGFVPGTHEVLFDAPFEQIRLEHVARDRRVFADGALLAAEWLAAGGRTGVFTMTDVLNGARSE
jgi:4-hydroxy-tetrahydrodipicolinate reductase